MNRVSLAAAVAVGFAIVSGLLGRALWAVCAIAVAAVLFLTILRNLTRGDR